MLRSTLWFSASFLLLAACGSDRELQVRNTEPNVAFTAPADGSIVAVGAPLNLVAEVGDPESGPEALTLSWQSGDGTTLEGAATFVNGVVALPIPNGLPVGVHTITLIATDPFAASGEDSVTIDVRANQAPQITWTTPAPGEILPASPPIVVSGTITDADTPDLATIALRWEGTVDFTYAPAVPNADGHFSFDLVQTPPGGQLIRLFATDPLGAEDTAQLAFTVTDADDDGDGYPSDDDCDDADSARNPDAEEIPGDGVDQNCDGLEDCYVDADTDGYRAIGAAAIVRSADTDCFDGGEALATAPDGDCDDGNARIHPAATEVVADGIDQNCDTRESCFVDADADGFRAIGATPVLSTDIDCLDAGEATSMTSTGDCDDSAASVHPGAPETCNGVDDDCDALLDEGLLARFYQDADADGFGSPSRVEMACTAPATYVTNDDDCDDENAATYPAATEVVGDGIDQNCDGRETCYDDRDDDGYLASTPLTVSSADFDCLDAFEGAISDPHTDCDDLRAAISPGAIEVVGDGVDQNCDGREACYLDTDNDGYRPAGTATVDSVDLDCADAGEGAPTEPAGDCDDDAATVHTGAVETCNGVDDDCDGATDEGLLITYYRDADGDTYGTPSITARACTAPAGHVANNNDCDDANASAYGGGAEVVGDGVDQDCDGRETCYTDGDDDSYLVASPALRTSLDADCDDPNEGKASDPRTDCDDANPGLRPGATEILANGIDENCDLRESCYPDVDADGYRPATGAAVLSLDMDCTDSGEATLAMTGGDCNDSDATIRPGATETASDGIDQNCDGREVCLVDGDNDGYLVASPATVESSDGDCSDANEGTTSDPKTDCNDAVATVYGGAPELTGDGVDQNCDGTELCFLDTDSDNFRRSGTATVASADLDCNDTGEGSSAEPATDCDDSNAAIRPTATETCNGVDDDCDTLVDEGSAITYYKDADGDTYGTPTLTTTACTPPATFVTNSTDCNDGNAAINPGATEIPGDGVDQTCDNRELCYVDGDNDGTLISSPTTSLSSDADCLDTNEGVSTDPTGDCNDGNASIRPGATEVIGDGVDQNCDAQELCFPDADSDNYRPASGASVVSADLDCADAGEGAAAEPTTDCNDTDGAIRPGATELCNGVDDDCDGSIDEGAGITYYRDADNDSFGVASTSTFSCTAPSGYVSVAGDCNDAAATIYPGATETPGDGIDQSCDGTEVCWNDADNDGYLLASPATRASSDGDCADANEGTSTDPKTDCNDTPGAGSSIYPGATEVIADGIDQNCDNGDSCHPDGDGDGYRPTSGAAVASSDLDCTDTGEASTLTPTNDCNDGIAAINPGASELTGDGVDQNCDGAETCWNDGDNDGYLLASPATRASGDADCADANEGLDTDPKTDCNDTPGAGASIYPGATEIVGDGIDQSCDGTELCYTDADGDTYGTSTTLVSSDTDCGDAGEATRSGDCGDGSAAVRPLGTETCNGVDDDCDGSTDEGVSFTYYRDTDSDNYGLSSDTTTACTLPAGYAASGGDCNDTTAAIRPTAPETIDDGIDQDCNGGELCFDDDDDDGYLDATGDTRTSADLDCTDSWEGRASDLTTDCNDNSAAYKPDAVEIVADGADQNCDGKERCFVDADSDGYRPIVGSATVLSADTDCDDAGEGRTSEPTTDCNDLDATIYPGATEIIGDEVDQSCDGREICFDDDDDDGALDLAGDTRISADIDCDDAYEGSTSDPKSDCTDTVVETVPWTLIPAGPRTESVVLTAANSPYCIQGTVSFLAGRNLTIGEGVRIATMGVMDPDFRWDGSGTLTATGTPAAPVVFEGLRILSADYSVEITADLSQVQFLGGRYQGKTMIADTTDFVDTRLTVDALTLDDISMVGGYLGRLTGWGVPTADWVITDSHFEGVRSTTSGLSYSLPHYWPGSGNYSYFIGLAAGDVLERNVFDGSLYWGWRIVGAGAVIRNNVFVNTNPEYPAVQVSTNDAATVEYNSFLDVNEVALALVGRQDWPYGTVGGGLVATNNYFGTTDPNKVQLALYDRTDYNPDVSGSTYSAYDNYILPNPILSAPHANTPPAP